MKKVASKFLKDVSLEELKGFINSVQTDNNTSNFKPERLKYLRKSSLDLRNNNIISFKN